MRKAKIVFRQVCSSARRAAIEVLSKIGASPSATVAAKIVAMYSGNCKTKARFGSTSGRIARNARPSTRVTTPDIVSPAFTRAVWSFVSGKYRIRPTPIPRLPRVPMNPSVWNNTIADPTSFLSYAFPITSQKKKPSPLEITDVSMMKIALRYRDPLTWSHPRPTSWTTRSRALFIRPPTSSSSQIAVVDKGFAQPLGRSVPSSR